MFELLYGVSLNDLLLLYSVELITLIYLLKKYSKSSLYVLIIFFFFQGMFIFLGQNINDGYKVVIFLFTLWVSFNNPSFLKFKKGDAIITILFVLFSLSYAYSALNNGDGWTIIFSQYSRYFIVYCLWFLVRNELYKKNADIDLFQKFIYDIFLIQIVITIAKLLIFGGRQIESIVGSLSHNGGSYGTTLPIVGFIMLWFYRRAIFTKKDWLFVVGLLLIGFLAGKRAIWFILPLVIAAFMIYVPKLQMNKTLWLTLIIAPLAFYLGVRLTPTLNPENKNWGSFDYEYAFGYADKYQYGDEKKTYEKRAQGRGGATELIFNKFTSGENLVQTDWFGIGLSKMYTTDYAEFDKLNLGIHSKGSSTGFFQSYVTTGYAGVFVTLFFYLSMLWQIKMKRIRWVLIAILGWEYFLYIGNFFRTPALMFMIIYFIHYSNYLLQKRPKKIVISQFIGKNSDANKV